MRKDGRSAGRKSIETKSSEETVTAYENNEDKQSDARCLCSPRAGFRMCHRRVGRGMLEFGRVILGRLTRQVPPL